MHKWKNVAIVGVGLIGGSIGLALRARGLAERICGVGRRQETLRQACEAGLITEWTTQCADVAQQADLVVVCTPVQYVAPFVLDIARRSARAVIITDAGSTKGAIVRSVRDGWPGGPARYIGSHPLAGSEKSGFAHAEADLFVGRRTIITPHEQDEPRDVECVRQFWQELGSQVTHMTPDEHDRVVAWVSHLPHLVAAALAATTPDDVLDFVATGWRDTTRVASGGVDLWSQIVGTNRHHLSQVVQALDATLQQLHAALKHNDPAAWERLLKDGKDCRDRVAD